DVPRRVHLENHLRNWVGRGPSYHSRACEEVVLAAVAAAVSLRYLRDEGWFAWWRRARRLEVVDAPEVLADVAECHYVPVRADASLGGLPHLDQEARLVVQRIVEADWHVDLQAVECRYHDLRES